MMQMEARLEELKKLIERVKILKDFQVACKKKTGRALSQKKDPRVQLISVPKLRARRKFNENKIPAAYKGPPENIHVERYKETLATFAVTVSEEKWSKEERENLVKGVKQQFQGMLLQRSVDVISETNGSYDSSNVDNIIVSIKDLNVTPEKIRLFLPKVNWEQLAAMYVPTHSAAECQARFLNFEDPLINNDPWTATEDKNLLHIVQQKGLSNWIDIAASLRTNRTPFTCLARYQRSLNASILKREWTNEEDNQLRAAVETCGESNWQLVASVMEGRTGTQCSNRWLKSLHPARKRVGKWTAEEDTRLRVAVTLFGPKTWKKVASYIPGRTQVQCRERWVNCLDPSLNMAEWTEEEDAELEAAIADHGYCWSKVAACIPHRTDNQCWRRWKALFPNEVPRLQASRKIQKSALISNFVDRESERPSLGPSDFILPEANCIMGSETVIPCTRKKKRSRRRETHGVVSIEARSSVPRVTNDSPVESMKGTVLIDGCFVEERENPHCVIIQSESVNGWDNATKTKKAFKLPPRRRPQASSLQDYPNTRMKKASRMQAGNELSMVNIGVDDVSISCGSENIDGAEAQCSDDDDDDDTMTIGQLYRRIKKRKAQCLDDDTTTIGQLYHRIKRKAQ